MMRPFFLTCQIGEERTVHRFDHACAELGADGEVRWRGVPGKVRRLGGGPGELHGHVQRVAVDGGRYVGEGPSRGCGRRRAQHHHRDRAAQLRTNAALPLRRHDTAGDHAEREAGDGRAKRHEHHEETARPFARADLVPVHRLHGHPPTEQRRHECAEKSDAEGGFHVGADGDGEGGVRRRQVAVMGRAGQLHLANRNADFIFTR
jgi:hypothetical protein